MKGRVAVIGCGRWGRNLVRTLKGLLPLGRLLCCDSAPEARACLRREHPELPLLPEAEAVWADPSITAVVVATPAATHYQMARAALLAGKDVFVEKPLALSVHQAEELVGLAGAFGRVLMVGHLALFQPAVAPLKRLLNGLGRLYLVHQERLNLGTVRRVENALWSLGVHDIALLLYLLGRAPVEVSALGVRALQPSVEDEVHLHLAFPGGLRAHLHASWLWPERRRRLVAVGERGMLVYDEVAQTITLHHKRIGPDLQREDGGQEVAFQGEGEALREELSHFLARLADRRAPLSDGASALEVVRVAQAAQRCLEGATPQRVGD